MRKISKTPPILLLIFFGQGSALFITPAFPDTIAQDSSFSKDPFFSASEEEEENEPQAKDQDFPESEAQLGPEGESEEDPRPNTIIETANVGEQDAGEKTKNVSKTTDSPNPSKPPQATNTEKALFNKVAPDIKKVIKSGQLRVSMCMVDQPPFHYIENGKLVGFDVELAHEFATALGVKLSFVETSDWDSAVNLLLEGKADMAISNLTLTPDRAMKVLCSTPYAKIRQCVLLNRVLLARASGRGLITLRQVFTEYENKKLAEEQGTSYVTTASETFPAATVVQETSWDKIMKKILERQCIGTISDEIEIQKQLKSAQTMELLPVILKNKYDLLVVCVSHESPQLLAFVNAYIESKNKKCEVGKS